MMYLEHYDVTGEGTTAGAVGPGTAGASTNNDGSSLGTTHISM